MLFKFIPSIVLDIVSKNKQINKQTFSSNCPLLWSIITKYMVYNGLIHQCGKGLSLSIHKKGNKQFLPTLFVPSSCLTVLSRYVNASFVKSSLPVALDSGGEGRGGLAVA